MKKYPVILADPPWSFSTYSRKGQGRSADAYYPTMGDDALCQMPVNDLADPDGSVLFMWVHNSKLPAALRLIEAWGFTYKALAWSWVKTKKTFEPGVEVESENDCAFGMGFYTRGCVELCLLATLGKKLPARKSGAVRNVLFAPTRQHSEKPDEQYTKIEALFDGPYLELFSRKRGRAGWDVHGNQVGVLDDGGVVERKWKSDAYPSNDYVDSLW